MGWAMLSAVTLLVGGCVDSINNDRTESVRLSCQLVIKEATFDFLQQSKLWLLFNLNLSRNFLT